MAEELPQDPPLVDVKVTNPVTYFKKWWNKIIGNEGIEFRFHIKPLTVILISLAVASAAFGVGRFALPTTFPTTTPSPTTAPLEWKDTAFTGTLQFSQTTGKYYLLVTSSSEAITLEVPEILDLKDFVGGRVFAAGQYSKSKRILKVLEANDMEILPKKPVVIPTLVPTSTPTASSSAEPIPTATPF